MSAPSSERLHIVLAGACNSGKSALINAVCGHEVALVTDVAGTTTDPVRKAVELPGIGACTIIDTAGLDDAHQLGTLRMERSRQEIDSADIIVALIDPARPRWSVSLMSDLHKHGHPVIPVLPKADLYSDATRLASRLSELLTATVIPVSSVNGVGLDALYNAVRSAAGRDETSLTGNLVFPGATVLLVMPQDPQAPKGRLILPQVQTLREILDKQASAICCTTENLPAILASLKSDPDLIVTDSQVFDTVAGIVPPSVPITSFSVLMAAYKGDLQLFLDGAEAITSLPSSCRVLIAESCSHFPQDGDIGRVKIPRLLRKIAGEDIKIDIVSGTDFPSDIQTLSAYDLIVHCGGCMFTRAHVLARIARARQAGVPVTNYGILIAKATGILSRVVFPT